ncbi:MAG: phosphoribosylanthranilate isomerase [Pseudomonadota bacterium]
MTTKVKICGLTRAQDVSAAISAGADWLGFIVEADSSRRLSVEAAAALKSRVLRTCVGVTVDPDDRLVDALVIAGFTHIQLHGSETLERVAEIEARTGMTVIKAMAVSDPGDVKRASIYSGAADWLLFDAKPPKGVAQKGGHGTAFDWDVLRGAPLPLRWGLAGGLGPHNVGAAVAALHPPLVDVSSGVEAAPGIKDAALMRDFVQAVKQETSGA